ncbi:MAG: (Fe-S)-binding protein [Leptothrix sp. (in: b-proteobacteria)]
MRLHLDWSAFDAYGEGDAYAALPAHGAGFGKAAAVCIGSRQCQKARGDAADKGVMCPSFRVTQDDLHSTRGRAARLRELLDAAPTPATFTDPQLAEALDDCVACKGCKRECPNGVDLAALRAEALAQRWDVQTPPWRTRFFADLPTWLPRLRRWQLLASLRRLPGVAALAERWLGIAARRSLPRIASQAFLDATPAPAEIAAPVREVVLLIDCFSNHLDPEIAQAALALLQAGGYRVHLLQPAAGEAPYCCGRSAFSAGLIDAARTRAQRLVSALAPHVAAGRPVIGLEPSCLSMLRDEVQQLGLDTAQVQALAKAALMLEEFLVRELDAKRWAPGVGESGPAWERPGARPAATATGSDAPLQVLVHGHCHQKAFGTLKAMRKVLGAVPGLQVEWIESSCCGMAGSFGFEAEHFDTSMRMAELSLLPAVRAAAPEALIVASGTSCRHQIRDGAGREPIHLAQLLQRLLLPDSAAPR